MRRKPRSLASPRSVRRQPLIRNAASDNVPETAHLKFRPNARLTR